jgi:endonuclease G, mitochondrial
MSKQKKSHFILLRASWWSTLLAGAVIGIASQRIPEIKTYTDELIHPIETSEIFQEIKTTIGSYTHQFDIADQHFDYSHYRQDNSLPGHPVSSFIVNRSGYSLGYDARTRNPAWVYEHLTADNLKGDADRSQFAFKEDDTIPQHLRASPADYKGQGLDQGHMAPAADYRSSAQAMGETFYLTNICPQCPQLNRDYWAKLEKHVRDLTQQYAHVYVITGPLYLPYQEGKRRFVKYQVIGTNDVAVPSHFFKVIMLEDGQGKREVRAYVLPNAVIPSNTPLDNFRTTVQKVEKAAGILLFNQQTS